VAAMLYIMYSVYYICSNIDEWKQKFFFFLNLINW